MQLHTADLTSGRSRDPPFPIGPFRRSGDLLTGRGRYLLASLWNDGVKENHTACISRALRVTLTPSQLATWTPSRPECEFPVGSRKG